MKNCDPKDKSSYNTFLDEVFKSSHWFQNKRITFKRSSSGRYVSLVHDRKRIGTLVSMGNQAFKFRIGYDDEILIRDMEKNHLKVPKSDSELETDKFLNYEEFIKDYNGKQTGWGESEIDIQSFMDQYPLSNALNQRLLRRLLNQVYHELTVR